MGASDKPNMLIVDARTADRSAELSWASRLGDELLATMAHELHTSRNGLLSDGPYGPLPPQQADSLRSIGESVRHRLAMINDMLDLSKSAAGTLVLHVGRGVVAALSAASLRLVAQQTFRNNLAVTSWRGSRVATLGGDKRRLNSALVDLLSNTLTFTPAGGRAHLEVRGDPAHRTVDFTIPDTGIGIPSASPERLLTPSVRVDSGRRRQHEAPGSASRWCFSGAGRASAVQRRSLLAENKSENSALLQEAAEHDGFQGCVMRDGSQALAVPVDTVVPDVQMPGLDWPARMQAMAGDRKRWPGAGADKDQLSLHHYKEG